MLRLLCPFASADCDSIWSSFFPGMLDHIQVDSYGAKVNLAAVAQASLKGPQLIVLAVYDPGVRKSVDGNWLRFKRILPYFCFVYPGLLFA